MAGCTNEDTPIFYWGTEITQSLLGCLCITWLKFRISSCRFSSSGVFFLFCSMHLFICSLSPKGVFLLLCSTHCFISSPFLSPKRVFLLLCGTHFFISPLSLSPKRVFLLLCGTHFFISPLSLSPKRVFLLLCGTHFFISPLSLSPKRVFLLLCGTHFFISPLSLSPKRVFLLLCGTHFFISLLSLSPKRVFLLLCGTHFFISPLSLSPKSVVLLLMQSVRCIFTRLSFSQTCWGDTFCAFVLKLVGWLCIIWHMKPCTSSLCFASLWLWSAKYFVKITIGQSVGKQDALFNVDGMAASTGPICMRGWWHELLLASSSPTASCNRLDFLLGAELASTLHDLLSTPFLSLLTSRGWVSPVVTWTLDGCLLVFFLSLSDSRLDVALSSALCDLPLATLCL